ncbi:unnamed protein product [Closterium sp. Naga37s-1]|nr:unnamed protein product [Closterium sp. Naga37s-1]
MPVPRPLPAVCLWAAMWHRWIRKAGPRPSGSFAFRSSPLLESVPFAPSLSVPFPPLAPPLSSPQFPPLPFSLRSAATSHSLHPLCPVYSALFSPFLASRPSPSPSFTAVVLMPRSSSSWSPGPALQMRASGDPAAHAHVGRSCGDEWALSGHSSMVLSPHCSPDGAAIATWACDPRAPAGVVGGGMSERQVGARMAGAHRAAGGWHQGSSQTSAALQEQFTAPAEPAADSWSAGGADAGGAVAAGEERQLRWVRLKWAGNASSQVLHAERHGDGAGWEGAEGEGAVCEGAVWEGAVWEGAVWEGAVWEGAVWEGAVWEGAVWEGAVWEGAVWEGAVWEGAVWEGAVWEGAVWEGAVWEGAVWEGAVWEGAVWEGAVVGAVWEGAVWEGAVWEGAVWEGAVWEWEGAVWEGAVWEGAVWEGAVWEGAVWEGAVWEGAVWEGAVWEGAVWEGATLTQQL